MLKTIAFIVRKAETQRTDFRDHYENHHVHLAMPHIKGVLRKYVRNHIHSAAPFDGGAERVEPGFDCATEFWYPDQAALEALVDLLESDVGAAIRADELSFMDKDANAFCIAEETLVLGPERSVDLGDTAKVLALAKRPAHQSREEFFAHYAEKTLPALLEGPAQPLRCTQNRTLGFAGVEPPYDCVTELWYPAADGIPATLAGLAPDAERWQVLRVLESETAMGERG